METQESVIPAVYPNGQTESANGTALFSQDPEQAFTQAQRIVNVVAQRCTGPGYLVNIRGKQYPKIEWWTTVSASLGLFPQVVFAQRLDRDDEIAYEAKVAVYRQNQIVASGEAMCSSKEERWSHADEYAIKSMAITRASGKAYRIPLSFLAVMAGLEATPAEEIPTVTSTPSTASGDSATAPQIASITRLARDQRLTDDERMRIQGLLLDGMSKVKASEVMEYFYGKSIKQGSEWVRVEEGVLSSR
jgi:hypothetical protein